MAAEVVVGVTCWHAPWRMLSRHITSRHVTSCHTCHVWCGVVPAVGKGDCTVRISDSHLMDLVAGKLSPQKVSYILHVYLHTPSAGRSVLARNAPVPPTAPPTCRPSLTASSSCLGTPHWPSRCNPSYHVRDRPNFKQIIQSTHLESRALSRDTVLYRGLAS